jgi:hypothetical protein
MKHLFASFLVVLILFSCKKDDSLPSMPESDILSGSDTLLYGDWKYLNSFGGYAGGKIDKGISLLLIKPMDDFIIISKDNAIVNGKFVINNEQNSLTKILLLQNGSKSIRLPQSIQFIGTDTLILNDPCCDMYSDTYKRIK